MERRDNGNEVSSTTSGGHPNQVSRFEKAGNLIMDSVLMCCLRGPVEDDEY